MKFSLPFAPLYFLSALGSGGIAVSFFMYFMFLTPHPETPIPTLSSIMETFSTTTNPGLQGIIVVAYIGMIIFSLLHFFLLFKNISAYTAYKKTEAYQTLKKTNAEAQLQAIPLTLGMTMNVLFTLFATLVPNAWSVIEYIFPFSLVAFVALWIYSLSLLVRYYARLFREGNFEYDKNNNLSQLLPFFAQAMIAVGLSGPAAMSHNKVTASVALTISLAIFSYTTVLFIIQFIIGIKSSLRKGWMVDNSPSIWLIIPFLTLFGIALIRYQHAFHTVLGMLIDKTNFFFIAIIFVGIQAFFGILGYMLMKTNGYFENYTRGKEKSINTYALICPGIAAAVFGFFALHRGFVDTGIISNASVVYFVAMAFIFFFQIKTILVLLRANKKLLPFK